MKEAIYFFIVVRVGLYGVRTSPIQTMAVVVNSAWVPTKCDTVIKMLR
jgi:hypothetical protein